MQVSTIFKHPFSSYWILSAAILLLALLPETVQSWLLYERNALVQGQIWRAFSAHLLHSNHWHLLMNIAGLLLVMLLHGGYYHWRSLLLLWLLCAGSISSMLYLFSPQIHVYVGLSGLLHAMLAMGAIKDIQLKQRSGILLLAGLLAKVLWEQWQGPDPALAELINASVATDAHLYGVFSGAVVALSIVLWQLVKTTPEH
uniref:Membrane protein, Rhomboid family n=1 Tax=Rheinheimera sp. BAL341 TaxID=1708203 RepID=A0A486XQI2_9GAMM